MLLNMMKRNDAVYTFPIKKKKPLRQILVFHYSVFQDFIEAVLRMIYTL